MKILKRSIFIIVIILLILLLIIASVNKFKKENNIEVDIQNIDISGIINPDLIVLNDHEKYYAIEKMLNSYQLYLKLGNKKAVYSLLDKEYTVANTIDETNAIEKMFTQISVNNQYIVDDIYIKQDSLYPLYLIKIKNIENLTQEAYYIFYNDNVNGTVSIKPIPKEEYYSYIQGQSELKVKEQNIEYNEYNSNKRIILSKEERIQKYYQNFQKIVKYNIEEAYNMLNEEYRNKRFGDIEKFKQYINNVKNSGSLEKYRVVEYEDYIEYIYRDEYNNYYIFNSTSAFEYNVMLDIYTIDSPDFIERYNKATDKEKFQMNLEKVINAVNTRDYEYVYNKLDDTFKQTNYKTLADFENYIKQNYNMLDEIEYGIYQEVAGVSIAYITIKNEDENKEDNFKVVMRLNEGTDFVMSFGKEQ